MSTAEAFLLLLLFALALCAYMARKNVPTHEQLTKKLTRTRRRSKTIGEQGKSFWRWLAFGGKARNEVDVDIDVYDFWLGRLVVVDKTDVYVGIFGVWHRLASLRGELLLHKQRMWTAPNNGDNLHWPAGDPQFSALLSNMEQLHKEAVARKADKKYDEAAALFVRASEAAAEDEKFDANCCLLEASKCYKVLGKLANANALEEEAAYAFQKQQKYSLAGRHFEECAKQHCRLQNTEAAIRCYLEAINCFQQIEDSRDTLALFELAKLYAQQKRYHDAANSFGCLLRAWDSGLLRFHVPELFLSLFFCHVAMGSRDSTLQKRHLDEVAAIAVSAEFEQHQAVLFVKKTTLALMDLDSSSRGSELQRLCAQYERIATLEGWMKQVVEDASVAVDLC